MGDLVQREHPQNYGRKEVGAVGPGARKSCHISEMVQDRTEVIYFYGLIGSRIGYALSNGTKINDLG